MYFRLLLVSLLTYGSAVNIKRIDVPRLVALGSTDDTILDCDYSLGSSTGLVVKWFFNENSKPVYQWIPPHKPQDMGFLKGKIDLTYKVSDDPLQAHRALKIIKPAVNMSGNYLCVVSTFEDEDYKSKTMLVFSPGERLTLSSKKVGVSLFNLMCKAERVYPQPTMSISSFMRTIKDVKSDIKVGEEGLFDIASSVAVEERDDLETEEFVCELRIPQANYTSRKTLTYYHGLIPTAQLAATENKDTAENDSTEKSIHVTLVMVGLFTSVL